MDPNYSAQDVARCDICKTAIVQSYCEFCHINLCKPCIGEHISDDYQKHTIVPFQQRRSTLIYPKCETHPNKVCKYQCKECNIFVCSHCVASKHHNKEHEFLNVEEVLSSKKEHIKKEKEEIEKQLLPAYEEIAFDLENQMFNLDGNYRKLNTVISNERAELHREVDITFNQMVKDVDEIKKKHHKILKEHLDEIKELQSLMQQTLIALNEMEASNEVFPTIQYISKDSEFFKLPPKILVSMPNFISNQMERKKLSSLIGKITPISTTLQERVVPAQSHQNLDRELLDEFEVLNTIGTGHNNLLSVTCLNGEQIWTSGWSAEIKCLNIQGLLSKTIKTQSGERAADIAVESDGALVYVDWKTRTVFKAKNDQAEKIVTLQGWIPAQLCITALGDILVTMYSNDTTQSKVVRYSGSTSTVKQTIQFDENNQPLFSGNTELKYISENRNFDVCVADRGANAVVVVNQAGKLQFRYTGEFSHLTEKQFKPSGITTDSQSRILTADCNNHCVHIIDAHGQFLRLIDNCDLENPVGLCVDSDDSLFVCEYYRNSVKKIRYSR